MPQALHTCYRCGGSCQGPGIPVSSVEKARIQALSLSLGVENPVLDNRLRTVGTRCLFLQADNLCQLEIEAGAEAKPAACQAFPAVHLSVGGMVRRGVDPACLTGFLSTTTGSPLPPLPPVAVQPDPEELAVLKSIAGTISASLGRLMMAPCSPGEFPAGLHGALTGALPELLTLLTGPGTAPAFRARLRHLHHLRAHAIRWEASQEIEAHSLDCARRMVEFRLGDTTARQTAMNTLIGAGLCAAASPHFSRFAPAFAAWTRLQRTNALRQKLDDLSS